MVIGLEQSADLHMPQLMLLPLTASCLSKIQIGFTLLVLAHPDSPRQRVVKWVCVCYTVTDFRLPLMGRVFNGIVINLCLQCSDTVGWAAGRASGL